jgi:hypothetical protein
MSVMANLHEIIMLNWRIWMLRCFEISSEKQYCGAERSGPDPGLQKSTYSINNLLYAAKFKQIKQLPVRMHLKP